MSSPTLDVVAVGNALVDVLSNEDDSFLVDREIAKGSMALIDAEEAEALYEAMGTGTEMSGGSAANTMAGVASFGGDAAFIGRIRDDELGKVFAHDISSIGVRFDTVPAAVGLPTGRCLILVTPDAERTMNTFLGAASELCPDDISQDLVAAAQVTYLEGYLFDQPEAKEAFRHAARLAHDAGRRVALTLSDGFCVGRYRDDFQSLVEHDIDILFANEAEICSLYEVDDFDVALQRVKGQCEIAALTRGEKGSVIANGDEVHVLDIEPVTGAGVVDTTGAGDLYAAGFLYGFTHGRDLETCGRLGGLAAAEVISHLGARPQTSLASLATSFLT